MKRILMLAAATLVLVLPASSSAATISVKIVGNAFQPAKITVDSGDVVQWTNNTSANRQVVADEGGFASPTLKPGQSYSFTFKTAGSYAYHDALHPGAKGSVTVQGPPPAVTLDIGAAIVTYGNSTTLTGKISTRRLRSDRDDHVAARGRFVAAGRNGHDGLGRQLHATW